MYKFGGSSQVTLPEEPTANVQHEFNASVKTVHVQVVNERQQFRPVETAKAVKAISVKKQELNEAAIRAFRKTTQHRIRQWRDENVPNNSAVQASLSMSMDAESSKGKLSPTLKPSVHKEVHPSHGTPKNPVRITDSPEQARMCLLRYAETRKAAESLAQTRIGTGPIDLNISQLSARCGGNAAQPTPSTFEGRDKYNERMMIARRQASVRKLEMEMSRRAAHKKTTAMKELEKVKQDVMQRKERIKLSQAAQAQSTSSKQEDPATTTTSATKKPSISLPARRTKEESIRYIAALEDRLRSKAKARNLQVPSLCNCEHSHSKSYHSSKPVWERCAKDCVFYNNPQAYARALGDIFRSLEN